MHFITAGFRKGIGAALAALVTGVASSNGVAGVAYSGAEIWAMNGTGAFFPSVLPTLSGGSLIFGGTGSGYKLLSIPLVAPGDIPASGSYSLVISLNLTRLQCGSAACGPATYDSDPNFLLTDGDHMVGALTADNDNGSALGATFDDAGSYGTARHLSPSLFVNAGYPAIGAAYDVTISFAVNPGETDVSIGFNGSTGNYSETVRALDPSKGLAFILLRDVDDHGSENYQLNSVTYPNSIPVPAPILLFCVGYASIILVRRVRNRTDLAVALAP